MRTVNLLPLEIQQEIGRVLAHYRAATLPVYAEAEKIRVRWLAENVALEDIIGALVEASGTYGVAIAFDPSEAREALLGIGTGGAHIDGHAHRFMSASQTQTN